MQAVLDYWNRKKLGYLFKFIGSAIGCGCFMFLAWSALFPTTLRFDNFLTKIFVFILAFLFDIVFCLAMYTNFMMYRFCQKEYEREDQCV